MRSCDRGFALSINAAILVAMACGSMPWLEAAESPPDRASEQYRVKMVTVSERSYAAIKYNVVTGRSWRMQNGKWVPIAELENVEKSKFEVEVTPIIGDICAIRLEVASGRSWRLRNDTWEFCSDGDDNLSP